MSTGISIKEIRNEQLQKLALQVDASNVSRQDNFIDEAEFSVFMQKAESLKECDKELAEIMGLFKSAQTEKPARAELSWGEIGKQALKSTKNFFKGMFCDEKGFSIKRTLSTIGTVAVLALAAPAAAALGAGAATVGAIALGVKAAGIGLAGYMAYNGGKNLVEGTKAYYNAETHEEAQSAMEKAMDGAVETALSAPAVFGIFKGANKGLKNAKVKNNNTGSEPAVSTETNAKLSNAQEPSVSVETNTKVENYNGTQVETTFDNNGNVLKRVLKSPDGGMSEAVYDNNGRVIKHMCKDSQGNITEISSRFKGNACLTIYTENGNIVRRTKYTSKQTIEQDACYNKTYVELRNDRGQILKRDFCGKAVRGFTKSEFVYDKYGKVLKVIKTDANGKKIIKENIYDNQSNVIKQTYTYEPGVVNTTTGYTETYTKGMLKEIVHEKGLRKEVSTDMQGNTILSEWYDRNNMLVERESLLPDEQGRVKIKVNNNQITEIFADGTQKVTNIGVKY